MAWIDDRIWCHPKLADLSDRAFRVWVNGIAYSTGFGTRGHLTAGQQRTIGCDDATRDELTAAGVWDARPDGGIAIHDWDNHNEKRDARRARDRQRKRDQRAAERQARLSADTSALSPGERPQDSPQDAPQSRRAVKEVKEVKEKSLSSHDGTNVRPLARFECCAPRIPASDPRGPDGPCGATFRNERELRDHLDHVHWLDEKLIDQLIARGAA